MKTRSILLLLLAAAALALMPTAAVAGSATQTYELVMEVPNVAQAPTGDQVAVTGEGEFQVHPKGVEAPGAFSHTDSEGNVVAYWRWPRPRPSQTARRWPQAGARGTAEGVSPFSQFGFGVTVASVS